MGPNNTCQNCGVIIHQLTVHLLEFNGIYLNLGWPLPTPNSLEVKRLNKLLPIFAFLFLKCIIIIFEVIEECTLLNQIQFMRLQIHVY